ncbi:hypothetical protein M406DRAFT_352687 [Cryphonectria parasitica EP155]|uniref:YTH domain-containing family protein 1 n=1 Tax=Cryphonectria parasitica (strain ATCC 38755 / EP155) TaxID=660469 RepID=YTH1_CRYP1|nr:uncharacterized protein M406DRAFT_352687 [Cryphonectria parasitica EP155]KAF3762299.1 hypothetical protein M406DRAFT_352687 [Cryphonectria parasitica EP155]
MSQSQVPSRAGHYNMTALANALPQANYRQAPWNNGSQMRYNPAGASPNVVGQTQSSPQYNGQPGMGSMPNQGYYMPQQQQQQQQMPQYYGGPMSPSQPQPNMSSRPNVPFYGNQVMSNHQAHPSMGYYYAQVPAYALQGHPPHQAPVDSQSNVVRGPPRKPRQSGHAIWIGNLPSQTDLMSLVHHVCREAQGLESLFLISKSNCAFANFRDEASCLTAQQKLHESKFQSVRLVSRLRKNTVEGASGITAPTGPSATTPQQAVAPEVKEIEQIDSTETQSDNADTDTPTAVGTPDAKGPAVVDAAQKDRFFVLKSLTVEDLDLSVRTGIWATQSHNEEALNSAFKNAENVYLVFSANKSGEYFGYARMVSTINEDPAAAIEFAPKAQSVNEVDLPREIPTEPTKFTPKGRIIDDSARGTIFWEIAREDSSEGVTQEEPAPAVAEQDDTTGGLDGNSENKTWGKPFKLEWLSTTRLPFYRCRGLRNPWNSNREVKIARDGTELEPSVGRRLIGLFNRSHNSPGPRGPMMGMGQMMSPSQQQMPMGYPPPYS